MTAGRHEREGGTPPHDAHLFLLSLPPDEGGEGCWGGGGERDEEQGGGRHESEESLRPCEKESKRERESESDSEERD